MRPQLKQVVVINQQSTTNGATATGLIDTQGFSWLTLDVITTTSDAATNNPSVLKLSECDTSNGTFTDVDGFVGDSDFDIPDAVTSGNWGVKFNVDLRGRKRYLKLSVSPTTTQTITAIANLGVGSEAPVSASDAGVKALVEG